MFSKSAPVAQGIEQRTSNPWAVGSIPTRRAIFYALILDKFKFSRGEILGFFIFSEPFDCRILTKALSTELFFSIYRNTDMYVYGDISIYIVFIEKENISIFPLNWV